MGIHNIAIMASGKGSNARAVIKYVEQSDDIQVGLLLSNKSTSGIPQIAADNDLPYYIFSRQEFADEDFFLGLLEKHNIDFIILAGFLKLIPVYLVRKFHDRIMNIHPALLPAYGGKGMYGMNIHRAVFANKEKVSGLTIHLVNENYDEGRVIFQHEVPVDDCQSADEVGYKILKYEHKFYPEVIVNYIREFSKVK